MKKKMGAVGGEEMMMMEQMQWENERANGGGGSGGGAREEKIFVSVRLRPLNAKEASGNDFSDWETINNTTIVFKNCLGERHMYPNAYSFDRVFGCDSSTRQVYEESAKEVALSVLNGINSSVFAYGQTSSGKTYTMGGITLYSIADIYDYIDKHTDREFSLKFSAMEIYNEAVRDLLSSDATPLRLLDDPERGTVVEKLTEEVLRDKSHLLELLAVCEAQRQIGETSLNETSSRSHQILRLTVESSARRITGAANSSTLAATVNFVDLAGSERASQTNSAGTRLKEGCHINRSLLTLGTVIRKLSKGRNGHVPYRDSKLTRILQNSLGGNARTAIICTMSPAHSHLEQSRNTLLFASCAKEVSTNAQVNVVMSDKALVRQLRKELARLEGELRNMSLLSSKADAAALLRDKELQIEKMDREIKELSQQRDLAESRIEELMGSMSLDSRSKDNSSPRIIPHRGKLTWYEDSSVTSDATDYQRLDMDLIRTAESFQHLNSRDHDDVDLSTQQQRPLLLDNIDTQLLTHQSSTSLIENSSVSIPDPCPGYEEKIIQRTDENSEDNCKEVRCIEDDESRKENKNIESKDALTIPEEVIRKQNSTVVEGHEFSKKASDVEGYNQLDCAEHEALVKKIQELQRTIDSLVNRYPMDHSSPCSTESDISSSCRGLNLVRSRSCKAILTSIPSSPGFDRPPYVYDVTFDMFDPEFAASRPRGLPLPRPLENGSSKRNSCRMGSDSQTTIRTAVMNEMEHDINNTSLSAAPTDGGSNEAIKCTVKCDQSVVTNDVDGPPIVGANNKASKEDTEPIDNDSSGDSENDADTMHGAPEPSSSRLWVPVARQDSRHGKSNSEESMCRGTTKSSSPSSWTQEFEKQRKRIIQMWDACQTSLVHRTYFFLLFKGDPSDSIYMEVELRRLSFIQNRFAQGAKITTDGQIVTQSSSARALNQEREMLSKQMSRKFSPKDREALFEKWGIKLDSKRRRLQLACRLWSNTEDIDHIKESASLVAKLVGFVDESQVPKEMFVGPNFSPKTISKRSYSWKGGMSTFI